MDVQPSVCRAPARLLLQCCLERHFSMSNQCLSQTVQFVSEFSSFSSDFLNEQVVFPSSSEVVGKAIPTLTFALISTRNPLLSGSVSSFSAILQCRILKNHLENKNWVSWDFLFLISHLSSSLFQEWNLDICCHLASLTYSAAVLVFRVVKVCKMLDHNLD